MSQIEKLIEIHESNKYNLAKALKEAGGDYKIILSQSEWKRVMLDLARNSIRITTEYIK